MKANIRLCKNYPKVNRRNEVCSEVRSEVRSIHAVGMQYTVGMQYAVGVSAKKVNSHSGLSKYGWWGPLPLVQKGQTHAVGYTVCSRYAV